MRTSLKFHVVTKNQKLDNQINMKAITENQMLYNKRLDAGGDKKADALLCCFYIKIYLKYLSHTLSNNLGKN